MSDFDTREISDIKIEDPLNFLTAAEKEAYIRAQDAERMKAKREELSRTQELQRLEEERIEREHRRSKEEAARRAQQKNTSKSSQTKSSGGSSKTYNSAESYTTQSSSIGQAVADYAVQFVGNPYVYGGTSLTNGADCSGFVMSVYANFGVSLPHSSAADRHVGAAVDGLANAQPGDLVCYSGHVGLYIGGGQIVHASTSRTGIIISNASYRTPLAVRRIF